MKVYALDKLVKFSPQGHQKRVFFESAKIKAQVMKLEAGQQIPPCRMDHDVMFVVLEGKGKIIVDGEEEAIKKTSWIFVPKESERADNQPSQRAKHRLGRSAHLRE